MTKPIRVLVPVDSDDEQAFGLALAYAQHIATKVDTNEVILLTHSKQQLSGTSLSRILGPDATKTLNNGKRVSLKWGGHLTSETMKTLRYQARNAVIIAYYSDEKLLDFADELRSIGGIIAVPWQQGEADGWAARWNAIIYGQEPRAPKPLIDDPVVVRALKDLTTVINPTTGLGHPRDKARANETLRILRSKGHRDPSSAIKSWAIQHNWTIKGASDLEALAVKIWSLKSKPSLADFHDPNSRYERWRTGAD